MIDDDLDDLDLDAVTEEADERDAEQQDDEEIVDDVESDDDDEEEDEKKSAKADDEDDDADDEPEEARIESLDDLATALDTTLEDVLSTVKGRVVVNGEAQDVTLQEALRGYQRQLDYDRGRTELNQQLNDHSQQVATHQQQAQEQLLQTGEFIQSLKQVVLGQANDPRIQALQVSTDPAERLQFLEHQQATQQKLGTLAELEQQAANNWQARQQEALAAQQEYQQRYLQEQNGLLLQAVPDWDQDKARQMSEYLTGMGFTPEEVGTIADHRMVMVALKAQAYDAQQKTTSAAQKKVSKLPKLGKPGKPQSKKSANRGKVGRLAARARKTGHPDDAAAAIEHLL